VIDNSDLSLLISDWFNPENISRMMAIEYVRVMPSMTLKERFSAIRRNYRTYQKEVDAGDASWMHGSPYEIADWLPLFSPIEQMAWQDIRAAGLPLWPQLPVGRFFVDFGNPEARVALECDGKAYHNTEKDAARDRELAKLGWTVIRVPGWRCNKLMESPNDILERTGEIPDGYLEEWNDKTMAGVIDQLRGYLK